MVVRYRMAEPSKSRFWAGSDSSESESDGSLSSDNEEETGKQNVQGGNKWFMDQESDSEDEQTRVVKSAQSKAEDAFAAKLKELRNSLKIQDWNRVSDCFQEFNSLLTKHSEVVKANGTPRNYLAALKVLQGSIEELSKNRAAQKKLSKTNAKSFNALRGRMKKHMADYQEEVDTFEEKHLSEEDSEGSESDSDSDSDSGSEESSSSEASESEESEDEPRAERPKSKWLAGSDSEDWDEDESSSSSSDSEAGNLTGRARWVKREKVVDKEQDKLKKEKERLEKERKRKERREVKEEKEGSKLGAAETKKEEVLTPEILEKQVMIIIAARGKKGVNRADQVVQLRQLSVKAIPFGAKQRLPMLMHLITAQFDYKSKIDEHMPTKMWRKACKDIFMVMRILRENQELRLGQVESDTVGAIKAIMKGKSGKEASTGATTEAKIPEGEKTPAVAEEKKQEDDNVVRVVGDLSVFVERLANEYQKSLRHIDQHSREYIDRLSDEADLIKIARLVMEYMKRIGDSKKASRLTLLCIEHIYYKHDSVAVPVHRAQAITEKFGAREFFHPACWTSGGEKAEGALEVERMHPGAALGNIDSVVEVEEYDAHQDMEELCSYMYLNGDDRGRCRAMLCHIYHFSLHDKFYKARDLLLMSRLQDTIFNTEIETQILFNRMMVQLGLCAFRAGLIKECHSCLVDICSQGRAKELLAQGLAWRNSRYERNLEKEKAERRRLVPYHLHINLDLLECCHLVSAMLLEIPYQAKSEFDATNQVISKSFRRYLDNYARQVFTGPPENTRDHVMAAALALKQGEWKRCSDLLLNLTVWNLLPNPETVKEMMLKKIKEEALRTYMLAYSSHYKSMKLEQLCELFAMKENEVHAVVSKMMISDELQASWDQPTASIILHKLEPSHLQALALQFADKVAQVVDSNERAMGGGFEFGQGGKDREKGYGAEGKSNKNYRGPRRGRWQHGYRPQYKNKANTSYRKNRIKSKYGTATVET